MAVEFGKNALLRLRAGMINLTFKGLSVGNHENHGSLALGQSDASPEIARVSAASFRS